MKKNTIFLALVSLILMLGFASASAANVYADQVAGNVTNGAPGATYTVSLVIKNTFNQDLEDVRITLPALQQGLWTSAKSGNNNIQIANNQVDLPGKITSGLSSPVVTLVFTTNPSAVPATMTGSISFRGTYGTSGSSATIPNLPLRFTVNSAPSLTISQSTPALSKSIMSTKIVLNNTGNVPLTNIILNVTGGLPLTVTPANFASLAEKTISAQIDVTTDMAKFKFGENVGTITATSAEGATANIGYNIRKTFCSVGQVSSNLTLKNVDITEYNEDDDTWKPADRITLEVEVKANTVDSVDDVVVELGFFNEAGVNVVDDLIFVGKADEEVDLGDIDDDDEEIAKFEFRVPADMSKGNYKLAVKAYSDNEGESKVCVDTAGDFGSTFFYKPIKIENEKDEGRFVIFDNIKINPAEATCGDTVALTTDVFNIGTKRQDQVKVNLFNKELGLDKSFEIKKDLDVGDKQKGISFSFIVPKTAADKKYNLELTADYDYDDDQNEYDVSSDESTDVALKVFGCNPTTVNGAGTPTAKAEIVAAVDSEVAVGKNVVIKATIKNVGNNTNTYALGVSGIDSWAKLTDASSRTVTLAPGQSRDVSFTLTPNADVKGEQKLVVEAISDRTDSKTYSVTFPESKSTGINLGGNTLLWIVGIMNVVLLILIILVAIRISRR
ncbi:putative S-layer protein [Candidatus Pacearchaeota archaeon]|nr:putative S-layer protein [Candidatus Pacearchaeota archaeon]